MRKAIRNKSGVDVRYYTDKESLVVCKMRFNMDSVVDSIVASISNKTKSFSRPYTIRYVLEDFVDYFIRKRYRDLILDAPLESDTTIVFTGYARCSENDIYREGLGKSIAYSKALQGYRKMKKRVYHDIQEYLENVISVISQLKGVD